MKRASGDGRAAGAGRQRTGRWRLAGRVTAAGAAILALGAVSLAGAGPASASPGTPGKAVRASSTAAAKLELTVHRVSDASQQAMDDTFANSSIDAIANSVNHHLHAVSGSSCTADERATVPLDPATGSAYCWDAGDAGTQNWSPQGMTSSGDADADGMWGTDRVLLSGWASAPHTTAMGRIAVINDTEGSANRFGYRWVLPVIPTSGGTDFARFGSHMGGMVWWGDKLLVTASLDGDAHHNAIYVFSTKHIYRATTNASWIGHRGSEVSAHGYQYFWPAIGSYSVTSSCTYDDHSADRLPCFDGLSMDRSQNPYTLVANEWVSSGLTGVTSRIWRYKLAPTSRLMPIAVNSAGHADPIDVYDTDIVGMQGTLNRTEDGERVVYTADSLGSPGVHGIPWRVPLPGSGTQTAANATTSTGGSTGAQHTWAQHSEGMTFMADLDQVWAQTEWAAGPNGEYPTSGTVLRQRIVFAVPMGDLRSSLTS
ncbi:hypothetical protein [Actinacidiphila sp. bgisy145]|uniref:hypothetical protein n=1 Tax=Actinacidiphila sp. bgisy145 TaxID=3413792 RepID=UPI003EBC26B8